MPDRLNPWLYPAALLLANLSLMLPPANPLRVVGAFLLIGLLPGWWWSRLAVTGPLLRGLLAPALSYSFTLLATLLLHYLSGPVPSWQLLPALNSTALVGLMAYRWAGGDRPSPASLRQIIPPTLLLILAGALFLRAANLHYSEFQGDEALAMITAAEALEGHEDALFLRSKGPAEVLLPMALWRLSGVITEAIARLPFTVAALLAIPTIFLIGRRLADVRLGWLAAGFFALNGFMVAFGRIVQYQALVVWFSALAFLLALYWQQKPRRRLALLSGLMLGSGLLAHYDAALALPAVAWLIVSKKYLIISQQSHRPRLSNAARHSLLALPLFAATFLLMTLPFYLPFTLDPQANRTGEYVGGRIGDELRNNLYDFFHFTTFYSSAYYLVLSGVLVLVGLLALLWPAGRRWRLAGGGAISGIVAVLLVPRWFDFRGTPIDLSFLPFALLLLLVGVGLFYTRFHPFKRSGWQAVALWLAVPFLGYNFVVALGLTHIYTITPAWALLAALGWRWLETRLPVLRPRLATALLLGLFATATLFLWSAFIRTDVGYRQEYPASVLPGFWTPYAAPPEAGLFGFVHRTGWKATGQLINQGDLSGDYGSNEEPDITTWYTRGAPRACDSLPEFYFLADDVTDSVPLPLDAAVIENRYTKIGAVQQSNGKQMHLWQQQPARLELGALDEAGLAARFDATATPAAFTRSARGAFSTNANFGGQVRLVGYDLDSRRAYPGGRLPVTLYWQAQAPIATSYHAFAHLTTPTGPAAQADGVPVCWSYPTDAWRPGQIIADQRAISLPPDIAPGDYPLEVGLYLPDTFTRLDVLDEAGNPAGVSVALTNVNVAAGSGE